MKSIQGLIKRRILINYQIDPCVAQKMLPEPFKPKVIKEKAIVGVCQIRLEEMKPTFVSKMPFGLSSDNAAHRIAVEWDEDGKKQEGVYIFRRDTNSCFNSLAGGRIFPGVNGYANFDIIDQNGEVELNMNSRDGAVQIHLKGKDCSEIPDNSVFSSIGEISAFFEEGAAGYSPTRTGNCHQGLCLQTTNWKMAPFHVDALSTTFFLNEFSIPNDQIQFDSAVVMRDIEHKWNKLPSVG